jgi:quercetin dioxygenase-like cupin family protein
VSGIFFRAPPVSAACVVRAVDAPYTVWGDRASGQCANWSHLSEQIEMHTFGMPPGGACRHSDRYPAVFAGDEVYVVLQGTMVIANPQTGEVHRVRRGESVFFPSGVWHHVFADGPDELRVLEIFACPPGTSLSDTFDDLDGSARYCDDAVLGRLPGARRELTMTVLRDDDVVWRYDTGVLTSLLASSEALTVGTLRVLPGQGSDAERHRGQEGLYVLRGRLTARVLGEGDPIAFEVGPGDVLFVPAEVEHFYDNLGDEPVDAIFGVAPVYR